MRTQIRTLIAAGAVAALLGGVGAVMFIPASAEEGYTPPVMNCGPGTVPGWLNEFGDPTSCVGDNPCPEVEFGQPCPVDILVPEPVVTAPPVPAPVVPVIPPADPVREDDSSC